MYNRRRWAIIVGLGVIEVWIAGLMFRSVAGGHHMSAGLPAPALAAAALRSGTTTRSIETGSTPSVVIDDDGATLNVSVRSGASVSVQERTSHSGWVRTDDRPVIFERTADGVRISRTSGITILVGSSSRELEIVVPPLARLNVINAGPTTATGLRAAASFHSDDGPVSVTDHRGALHVTTDNGRIELTGVEAPLVQAGSDNGRIIFDRVRAERVDVKSDNGRIEIGRSSLQGGSIHTDDGRIALGLDPNSDVTVRASAASAKVRVESPLIMTAPGELDEDTLKTIRIGTGAGRLDVDSGDGSISVRVAGVQSS